MKETINDYMALGLVHPQNVEALRQILLYEAAPAGRNPLRAVASALRRLFSRLPLI